MSMQVFVQFSREDRKRAEEFLELAKRKSVFICDFCQKGFSSRTNLKRHAKGHTGQKEHDTSCHYPLCDYSSAHKGNIQEHIRRRHLNERPFKCQQSNCGAAFASPGHLKRHQSVHTKNLEQLSCTICPFKTYSNSCLSVHLKRVHDEMEPHHFCHLCNYSSASKSAVDVHIRRHLNERDFKCQERNCGASFVTQVELKNHQFVHNRDDKKFSCSSCPFKTHGKRHLTCHVKNMHSESKPVHKHFCSFCPFSTQLKGNFTVHIRRHLKERDFKCPENGCGAAFVTSTELKNHQLTHNKTDKKFLCSSCPFKTHGKSLVDQHMKTVHSKSRPFKCPHSNCEYSAKRKSNLTVHLKIHSEEKSQVCPHPNCEFKTKTSQVLKNHMITHSDRDKQFNCHFCTFSSHYHSSLVLHMRRHTGETPFACPHCSYKTKRGGDLTQHMKRHADSLSRT